MQFDWRDLTRLREARGEPYPTGSGTDLAFAVMVLASYFTIFSTVREISSSRLALLILLGILYIVVGIYGYAYCNRLKNGLLISIYFIVQIAIAAEIILLSGTIGLNAMILLPLAGHSVVLLDNVPRLLVNLAIGVTCGLLMRYFLPDLAQVGATLPVFLAAQIFIVIFTQMAVSEEKARIEIQSLVGDLAAMNEKLREYAAQAELLAVTRERNRMAREIHDGLGHHLTALNMQLKGAQAVLQRDEERARELIHNAETISHAALADVRQSVAALREESGQELSFTEKFALAITPARRAGITVNYNHKDGITELNPAQELALFRTLQECVSNTLKHANASTVDITLDTTNPDLIQFSFQDDGSGSDQTAGGYGLLGMRERITLLGGDLRIETAPLKGFRVDIKLPKGTG